MTSDQKKNVECLSCDWTGTPEEFISSDHYLLHPMYMETEEENALISKARSLVQSRITGHRKGMPDVPTHLHSFHVYQALLKHGFSEEVCLAGLLHDIIEDGGMTAADLANEGFSPNVIRLIKLCSHYGEIENKDLRWVLMVIELVKANDADAWMIKIADVYDNLHDAHAMRPERAQFMREVKAPAILEASKGLLGTHPLWQELSDYLKQV